MRIHCGAAVLAVLCGFFLHISAAEWCAVVILIGLVFFAEAMNTAVERTVDLLSPEKQPLAGEAKDIAAAAVLLSALTSLIVGAIIFLPKLFRLFG